MATSKKVLATAAAELGNGGGKYWQYFGYGYNDSNAPAWCCMFQNWIFAVCGMPIGSAMNCLTIQSAMLNAGFVKVNKSSIQSGDVVIFEWDRAGDTYDHIGICEAVLSSSTVQCIEGNCSRLVQRRTRYLADIRLVFRPNYDSGVKSGWLKESGVWHCYDNGTLVKNAWKKGTGANAETWFYLGSDGAPIRSQWLLYKGKYYHFGTDAAMQTNCFAKGEGKWAGKWFWLGSDGTPLKNQKVTYKGKTYWLGADGVAKEA